MSSDSAKTTSVDTCDADSKVSKSEHHKRTKKVSKDSFGVRDVVRIVLMVSLVNFAVRKFAGGGLSESTSSSRSSREDDAPSQQRQGGGRNLWKSGQKMDLLVYLTNSETDFDRWEDEAHLIWRQSDLSYDCDARNERELSKNLTLPTGGENTEVGNGTSFWAHIYFVKRGYPIDPSHPRYRRQSVVYRKYRMNRYVTADAQIATRNLLASESVSDNESETDPSSIEALAQNRWIPRLRIHLVHDFATVKRGNKIMPKIIMDEIQYDDASGNYFPHVYVNDLLLVEDHLIPLNASVSRAPLELTYGCMSMWQWQIYVQMADSWRRQSAGGFTPSGALDDMKRMIADTNPYLLAVTAVVTILHTIFDCLAFKNDVQFWRKTKSMKGLSLRSLFMSIFFQFVIFLYLLDSEKTSKMILVSRGLGLVIEVWKVKKAVKSVSVTPSFPFLRFESKLSYVQSDTKKFDDVAMNHLFFIIYPGVIGYALYALAYSEFKSWYSWFVSSLVGFIYVFGFVLMTPQLFLNYKMKSVAHMPWRSMVYRSLNTFIDDLYALIIPMPTLHRLACLRDDVIFFIFLYQRWIYPSKKIRMDSEGESCGGIDFGGVSGGDTSKKDD